MTDDVNFLQRTMRAILITTYSMVFIALFAVVMLRLPWAFSEIVYGIDEVWRAYRIASQPE